MRKWRDFAIYIFGAVIISTLWQNCAPFKAVEWPQDAGSSSLPPAGYYKKINSEIIVPKCVSCHGTNSAVTGGGIDYSTYAAMMSSGSIVAGQPSQSGFYTSSADASMPVGGPALTPDELQQISSWITNGALENELPKALPGNDVSVLLPNSSTTITGSGSDVDGTIVGYAWAQVSGPSTATLTGSTSATVQISGLVEGTYAFSLTVTDDSGGTGSAQVNVTVSQGVSFATLQSTVFTKCTSCHSTALAPSFGNYDMSTYAAVMKDVVSGNGAGSKLYQRSIDGTMPPGAPLTAAEAGQIKIWIDQGAQNN